MARHLISLADLADDELAHVVDRGVAFARGTADPAGRLPGKIIGIHFRRTSTRTRTAFSSGALRLGAQIVSYGPADLQTNTGESIEDTARVLSGMLDGFVARTAAPEAELRTFAIQSRMAVINAMSAEEHPTQGLADLTTLTHRFGRVDGLRVLYVGEGNNTASALALALCRFPKAELHLRTPPGYGVLPDRLAAATRSATAHGGRVVEQHDMNALPAELDVIYTSRWQTTGTEKADPNWRAVFAPFRVSEALAARYPRALVLHDLPAHRGEDIDASVLDGPQCAAFELAEHKLYSAMAVLEWCVGAP